MCTFIRGNVIPSKNPFIIVNYGSKEITVHYGHCSVRRKTKPPGTQTCHRRDYYTCSSGMQCVRKTIARLMQTHNFQGGAGVSHPCRFCGFI